MSVRFTALADYLVSIAPSRAQLRRQAPRTIEGLSGAWHSLLAAKEERKPMDDRQWTPVKSVDLAPGLFVERPCKRQRTSL